MLLPRRRTPRPIGGFALRCRVVSRARAVILVAVLLQLASTIGCGDDGSSGGTGGAGGSDAGADADGGPFLCPDPLDPMVHYLSDDPSQCDAEDLRCTTDQYGFDNACGCGCIDKGDPNCPDPQNPDVRYFSRDPAQCSGTPACGINELGFSNSCGCGCVLTG
jgi:hypothetical protein